LTLREQAERRAAAAASAAASSPTTAATAGPFYNSAVNGMLAAESTSASASSLSSTTLTPSPSSSSHYFYGQQQQYQQNAGASMFASVTTPGTSTPTASTANQQQQQPPSSASARDEWRKYGTGLTQALQEKRNAAAFQVRVVSAQSRTDHAGAEYTAYVLKVNTNASVNPSTPGGGMAQQQQQQHQAPALSEFFIERRYSDFYRLHTQLKEAVAASPSSHPQQSSSFSSSPQLDVGAPFPSKSLAGRLGNWTPSKFVAPERHDQLIRERVAQLDIWTVHVVARYHCGDSNGQQHSTASQLLHNFIFQQHQPTPCLQVSATATGGTWKYYNPVSFTLGTALQQATRTLEVMTSSKDQSIPLDLLHAAKGLLFLTTAKAGLVVTGRVGSGLVIARREGSGGSSSSNGSCWSAPCAIGTVGLGWGASVGGGVTHSLVVLTTPEAVRDVVASQSVQLGAELGVAVGPIGRGGQANVQTGDWTLHPAYTYSHSQGLFVGASLEGGVLSIRNDVNTKFYGRPCDASDLLRHDGPPAAAPLYQMLDRAMHTHIPDGAFRPSQFFQQQQQQHGCSPSLYGPGYPPSSGNNSNGNSAIAPPTAVPQQYHSQQNQQQRQPIFATDPSSGTHQNYPVQSSAAANYSNGYAPAPQQ